MCVGPFHQALQNVRNFRTFGVDKETTVMKKRFPSTKPEAKIEQLHAHSWLA